MVTNVHMSVWESQTGMQNNVQGDRNANVCKQTYDASYTCSTCLTICRGRSISREEKVELLRQKSKSADLRLEPSVILTSDHRDQVRKGTARHQVHLSLCRPTVAENDRSARCWLANTTGLYQQNRAGDTALIWQLCSTQMAYERPAFLDQRSWQNKTAGTCSIHFLQQSNKSASTGKCGSLLPDHAFL